ncbi:MAG: 8-oxo-dGTP diphosphatase MutT [Treponemataceae bacterium]|nr:MAG: 8-oxo-dGTP diphosphatase MutT [Treponemataceae bacterium]
MKNHSVAGIVLGASGEVLVAKRIDCGQMANRWEFPGGKVEAGESFEQAVVREFSEEFGCVARCGALIAEAEFEHDGEPAFLHAFRVYLADGIDDAAEFVLSEHTETAWVRVAEVKNLHFVDSDLLLCDAVDSYVAAALSADNKMCVR